MQASGLLVTSWPIVLGCDAGGEVAGLGEGVTTFKVGDAVCGCTRLGVPGYATFQEYVRISRNSKKIHSTD
jgi:NADPH:quinone reductase-like Zn-dependent oxidoreductase